MTKQLGARARGGCWVLGMTVVGAFVMWPSAAHADTRKACVESADHGQELRDKGKLTEARQAFVTCARDECPALVARQCVTWLGEVDREIPTVTIRARDRQNKDLVEVNVIVDDTLKASSLDGRSMSLDPGVHKLRFMHAGDAPVDQQVVIRSGEKDRIVDVRFGGAAPATASAGTTNTTTPTTTATPDANSAPPSEAPPKSGFRFPVFAGVMLGVGIASFVGMGVFVGTAASDVNTMRATCAGTCKQADVDWANTRIILANVAMGVGIAGLSLSLLSVIISNVSHSSAPATTTTTRAAAKASWHVDVGLAALSLSRTF